MNALKSFVIHHVRLSCASGLNQFVTGSRHHGKPHACGVADARAWAIFILETPATKARPTIQEGPGMPSTVCEEQQRRYGSYARRAIDGTLRRLLPISTNKKLASSLIRNAAGLITPRLGFACSSETCVPWAPSCRPTMVPQGVSLSQTAVASPTWRLGEYSLRARPAVDHDDETAATTIPRLPEGDDAAALSTRIANRALGQCRRPSIMFDLATQRLRRKQDPGEGVTWLLAPHGGPDPRTGGLALWRTSGRVLKTTAKRPRT